MGTTGSHSSQAGTQTGASLSALTVLLLLNLVARRHCLCRPRCCRLLCCRPVLEAAVVVVAAQQAPKAWLSKGVSGEQSGAGAAASLCWQQQPGVVGRHLQRALLL